MTDLQRFMSRTRRRNGCLEWTGARWSNATGYGSFRADGTIHKAHRWIFAFHNGPIPRNRIVTHNCDNSMCVDVDHLKLGTHASNRRECIERGRARFWIRIPWRTVVAIRRARAAGVDTAALSRKYKVSLGQVSKIANRQQRKER